MAPRPKKKKETAPGGRLLMEVFEVMLAAAGPRRWWPARTRFEVIVGAVLTQNTAWGNVEKAIANLRAAGALNPRAMLDMGEERLSELIVPAGYYRVKARRLTNFLRWFDENFGLSLDRMFRRGIGELRGMLLSVNGVGRETADSIILYAAGKPIFVIDAYTKRIFSRHGWCAPDVDYDELRGMIESRLPADAPLFNEYHALIVYTGNNWCRARNPRCGECPLGGFPRPGGA